VGLIKEWIKFLACEMDTNLMKVFFPQGLLDYFKVISCVDGEEELIFTLEELNVAPEGYKSNDIESKGFYDGGQVTDFPLRGKRCFYRIRRRKWLVKSDNTVITRDWNIVASGTKMTKEFASFLKELNR